MTEFIFKIPFLICCIAKRESGKSVLTKYLVKFWYENNDFDEIYAFTNTNKVNNEYEYLKKSNIINRFDEKKLALLMKLQEKAIIKYKSKENKKVKRVLLIMDDIVGSFDRNSPIMREIITQGRHYNISLILNIQIPKKEISPEFKQNSDYIIVGYNNKSAYHALYDEMAFDGKLSEFLQFMNKSVVDHNFVLYINKVMDNENIKDRYKIIRAENLNELEKFKIIK